MGIDDESEVAASLRVGPTTLGMVRVYIETEAVELPLDFDPEEAEEIAEELRAAAARAREARAGQPGARKRHAGGEQAPDGGRGPQRGDRSQGPPRGAPKRRRGSGSSS
jgi:hypothetical protein